MRLFILLGLTFSCAINFLAMCITFVFPQFVSALNRMKLFEVNYNSSNAASQFKLLLFTQFIIVSVFFISFYRTLRKQPQYLFREQIQKKDKTILWAYFWAGTIPAVACCCQKLVSYLPWTFLNVEYHKFLFNLLLFFVWLASAATMEILHSMMKKRLHLDLPPHND